MRTVYVIEEKFDGEEWQPIEVFISSLNAVMKLEILQEGCALTRTLQVCEYHAPNRNCFKQESSL